MLKSAQQKNNTFKKLEELKITLCNIQQSKEIDDKIRYVYVNSYESLIFQMEEELKEYDELCKGNYKIPSGVDIIKDPQHITKFRISRGISQTELAKRLGLDKQTINRYEEQDYQSASISRVKEVLEALGIDHDLEIPEASMDTELWKLNEERDDIIETIENFICETVKEHIELKILSICIGLDILKREANIGLLVKGNTSPETFIESFKQKALPIFKDNELKSVTCDFTALIAINKNLQKDKERLMRAVKSDNDCYVKELALCS